MFGGPKLFVRLERPCRLDVLTETDCRQIGAFAPVPQLLSQKKLAFWSKTATSEPPRSPERRGDPLGVGIQRDIQQSIEIPKKSLKSPFRNSANPIQPLDLRAFKSLNFTFLFRCKTRSIDSFMNMKSVYADVVVHRRRKAKGGAAFAVASPLNPFKQLKTT